VFQKARRVFIGYPLVRKEKEYNPQALSDCLVDPTCPDKEWDDETRGLKHTRNFTRNRNFVRRVTEGSIVVVPRPREGTAYLARIAGPFEIVDAPPWRQHYLNLREKQGLGINDQEDQHTADVAQGWPVDGYRPIPLSRLPGWLRRSLLGRSTYNELGPRHPLDESVTACGVLDQIIDGTPPTPLDWTLDPEMIKRRLINRLSTPSAFENLAIALLQLEYPRETWDHTGGPGDGGIDGIGSNEEGEVVGLLQAKSYADSAPQLPELSGARRYAAVLLPPNPKEPRNGTKLLNLDWIARAMSRHWRRLPLALTLRVGEGIGMESHSSNLSET